MIELEISSKTIAALNKIADHFALYPTRLAVYFLEWQLVVETEQLFTNLLEDKVQDFLKENCWDHETIQHLKTEVIDILE